MAKISIIPPLLEHGCMIDFSDKAQLFNDHFVLQCTTIDTSSTIPSDVPTPSSVVNDFPISDKSLLKNIIRSLNPHKAHG